MSSGTIFRIADDWSAAASRREKQKEEKRTIRAAARYSTYALFVWTDRRWSSATDKSDHERLENRNNKWNAREYGTLGLFGVSNNICDECVMYNTLIM